MGSASGSAGRDRAVPLGVARSAALGAGAASADTCVAGAGTVLVAPPLSDWMAGGSGEPSLVARQVANDWRSLPPTSEIMPRPNWAGLPVIDRSVCTEPAVSSPSARSDTVTVAAAVPLPRESLPEALITT